MKLKTATKIEIAIKWLTGFLLFPLALVLGLFTLVCKGIDWIFGIRNLFCNSIGNKLLRTSDEVKNGKIKNRDAIEQFTAMVAYKKLLREEKEEKETND